MDKTKTDSSLTTSLCSQKHANVLVVDERSQPLESGLASTLGQPIFILRLTDKGVQLEHQIEKFSPLKLDFTDSQFSHRRRMTSAMREPIAKAVGATKDKLLKILDLTAGIGRDAFILACYGCSVTLIESNPYVAALLEDALERGKLDPDTSPILNNMTLLKMDSLDYLKNLEELKKINEQKTALSSDETESNETPSSEYRLPYDVIYIDPMFPEKKKSAKSKKELQILQDLVFAADEKENEALFEKALALKPKRLVVKRPKSAPFIKQAPNAQQIYDTVRFDIYFPLP